MSEKLTKNDIDLDIVGKYSKVAPMLRNSMGQTINEPSLMALMIYLLDGVNTKLEKLIDLQENKAVKTEVTEGTSVLLKETVDSSVKTTATTTTKATK